jgi:myb proto-oncogene protein
LKDAVQKHGGKDWLAISALVPGRTNSQCRQRWHYALNPSINRASGRTGKWSEDEDIKLKDAVQTHGCKHWGAIAALVPGRTKIQCWGRWHDALDPSIDRANGRKGKWTAVEDSKLKDAVQRYGGKNWFAISALVPGRTKNQCFKRWHDVLDPSIDRANQYFKRWHDVLDPSIDRANGRAGKWTSVEDSKLKDAVQTHGDKDWAVIAALVPGRTNSQCYQRWYYALDPSIDRATGRMDARVNGQKSKTHFNGTGSIYLSIDMML